MHILQDNDLLQAALGRFYCFINYEILSPCIRAECWRESLIILSDSLLFWSPSQTWLHGWILITIHVTRNSCSFAPQSIVTNNSIVAYMLHLYSINYSYIFESSREPDFTMPGLLNEIRSDEFVHSLYTDVCHTLCNVQSVSNLYSKNNTYPTVNTAVCSSTFSHPMRVHPTIGSTSCGLPHIVATLTLDYTNTTLSWFLTFCTLKT